MHACLQKEGPGEGNKYGRGGLIMAAADGPGGLILAGDHPRRDSAAKKYSRVGMEAYSATALAEHHIRKTIATILLHTVF